MGVPVFYHGLYDYYFFGGGGGYVLLACLYIIDLYKGICALHVFVGNLFSAFGHSNRFTTLSVRKLSIHSLSL